MPHSTRLLFLAGSAREGSFNKKLARLAATIAEANGIPTGFADLGDYPMPIYDGDLEVRQGVPENALKLERLMRVHQGIFIASPEYNAGMTPLLKNTLDWISRIKTDDAPMLEVYKTRVFAIASTAPGAFGGIRGLIQLRQTLSLGCGALVLPDQLSVARAAEAFNDEGHLQDKAQQEMLKAIILKLVRAAKLLQTEFDGR
ncbi:MAG: NAD(P)H-dependent oxidoreductase [Hyphomicrobiaceae bacterium]